MELKKKDLVPCYIAEIRKTLRRYRDQIGTQIRKQETYYRDVASNAADGRRARTESELRFERARRSERIASAFVHGDRPIYMWTDLLIEYAVLDSDRTRGLIREDLIGGSSVLAGLESLRLEVARVNTLDRLLREVEQPDSLVDQMKMLQGFAIDTKVEFDKTVCAGLKTVVESKTVQLSDLQVEITKHAAGSDERLARESELEAVKEAKEAIENRLKSECQDR